MIADTWGHGVMRWHANKWPALRNSGDDIDAHSSRMAKLALWLWPDASRELLAAIALHDDAEGGQGGTGDVPGPGKVGDLGAALATRTRQVERARGTCMHLHHLHDTDECRLRFVDVLDAYRWAALCEPRSLADDGFPEALTWLLREAERLGVRDKVEAVLK